MLTTAGNESDLLRLLHSTEHSFVERKTIGDHKDWVKTVVAFANTLSNEQEGVLFIGATDVGEIESGPTNFDKLQKTFSEKMQGVYPQVYYTTRTVNEGGKECLAVIVPGSPARPHFAGPPYIRDGSQTFVASSQQYESLLAARTGKVYELQKWIDKAITIRTFSRKQSMNFALEQRTEEALMLAANQFYITVKYQNHAWSYSLNRFELSFDNKTQRLEIELTPPPV